MKEGDGVPGQRPFNGHGGEQRKGAGRWKAATRQEGAERERERERKGGCLTPTDGRRPTASGPRPAGAGGVAWPCRAVGPNRGRGGRVTGGAPTQWRAAAVE
jgi:hypothetical protein